MQSSAWPNERLDEFALRIDQRFEQVDQRFDRIDRDLQRLDGKVEQGFQTINRLLFRIGGSIIVALIGVIGAILATGA
jgi:hypothetical protein